MTADKFHSYRGDVRAVAAVDDWLVFVTVHPEGQPTAIYRLHGEKYTLTQTPLPAGGVALLATTEGLWVGGTDNRVYHLSAKGKTPAALAATFTSPPLALAPLANNRLAVAAGAEVAVVSREGGKVLQKLALPEAVSSLASDPTGQWLAAGTVKGTVAVFECETVPNEFRPSDSATLHDGAVTALLFEKDELRFFSAGADQKLLSTHARGKLEAEDRGRGANHEQPITALVHGPAGRFLSGSSDKSLKSWPPGRGTRPVTLKDGVGKVVALAVVPVQGQPQVVAACDDNTLRFFKLDEEGKFGDAVVTIHGVDDWAENELTDNDPKRREAALKALVGFADAASLERIADQVSRDGDHTLRLTACKLLGEAKHPRAGKLLEKGLDHRDEAVRVAAFEGLRRHAGPKDLRPLVLALKTGKADVGQRAVQALEGLAKKDDQAMARLVEAIDSKSPEVRKAALTSLENVHDSRSPEASLTALNSTHADLRRLALIRLYQRKLLQDAGVQAALRWRGEDGDPEVRRVAFLLSLHTRDRLLKALRGRDPELDRQVVELESGALPAMEEKPGEPAPPPVQAVPAAAGSPAPAHVNALISHLERLAGQMKWPPQLLEQLKKMAQSGVMLRQILGRVGDLAAAAGGRPVEQEQDDDEDEDGEEEGDE
jgi:ParB family chromosome partitioning protein